MNSEMGFSLRTPASDGACHLCARFGAGARGDAGLMEGQRVAVDVIDGRKGPEAAGLRLI
jgi:cold shock CspA family protein